MSGRRIPSFRHRYALVAHPDDNDRRLLESRLGRLGLMVHCQSGMPPAAVTTRAEIILFDVDTGTDGQFDGVDPAIPRIALIGSETPGRLEWMLSQNPSAYLMKPIRSSGIYTALAVAFHRTEQQRDMDERIARLQTRARSRDVVSAAVTQLMDAHGIAEPDAFRLLRRAAMDSRISMEALGACIVAGHALPERSRAGGG